VACDSLPINPHGGNRIATDARGVLVPAITIEELCKQNGIEKIDLLKLDIEGAEEQVLQNGIFLARTEHIVSSCTANMDFNASSEISHLMDSWLTKGDHPTRIW
jgi:hypothetical protein